MKVRGVKLVKIENTQAGGGSSNVLRAKVSSVTALHRNGKLARDAADAHTLAGDAGSRVSMVGEAEECVT